MLRQAAVVVLVSGALGAAADDLARAEQLAWSRRFAESEALYRTILQRQPASRRARLGLARVVMWRGRYAEAIGRFDELLAAGPNDRDALEGRATAHYWRGDLRAAARDFKRLLLLDRENQGARKSLAGIAAATHPSLRLGLAAVRDDQPLTSARVETSATVYSDPGSQWTAAAGTAQFDGGRYGDRTAHHGRIGYQTRWRDVTLEASAGLFGGGFVGGAGVRWRDWSLRVGRVEEVAGAPAIRAHAFSTAATLRWSRTGTWMAAVEASGRRYSDDNSGRALVAWFVAPVYARGGWTLRAGASGAARDTNETRFRPASVSSIREGTFFRYGYRGEYGPYWTPDDLIEARAVLALERPFARGLLKLHADGGAARDRGVAFGPEAGPAPLPAQQYAFTFDRSYRPYRLGLSAELALTPSFRIEAGAERSVTVDYRSTSVHAAVVRRR